MTHRNRRGRLERGSQLFNERQAARIVPLLCSMTAKALRERDAAASKQTSLLLRLLDDGINADEVRCAIPVAAAGRQPGHCQCCQSQHLLQADSRATASAANPSTS